jgi:glycosyltransferase involved in cell wall biosynthesis
MPAQIDASAYIICRDEREFLGDCLDSLDGFREIVIVDSGSTDGTLELIAAYRERGLPIRLFERTWPGYSAQKQFALDQCTSDWCFNLDADERLTPELRTWLSTFRPAPDEAAVSLDLVDYLPGYGYPPASVHAQSQRRFVRRDRVAYRLDLRVHEGMVFRGTIRKVRGVRIRHFRSMSVAESMQKALHYAELKAQDMRDRGRRSSLATMISRPLGRFFKYYLLHRYVLCGVPGLIYSVDTAIYVFLSEAKLYRKSLGADVPPE